MNNLKEMLDQKKKSPTTQDNNEYELSLNDFTNSNKNVFKKKSKLLRGLTIYVLISALLGGIVYIPAFIKDTNNLLYTAKIDNCNQQSIGELKQFILDNGEKDFDDDGLMNSLELKNKTDPFSEDSDLDGINDYYEIYSDNSNPNEFSKTMENTTKSLDKKNKKAVNSPYKIFDVILWADDISSKANGGVIKTINGYRFTNFKGFVQFPNKSNKPIYAYEIDNGIHKELYYAKEQNVFKISTENEIVLFNEPLDMTYQINLFNTTFYINNKFFGSIFDFILPEKGKAFIKCIKMSVIDTKPNIKDNVYTEINTSSSDINSSRFYNYTDDLSSIAQVRKDIENGYCTFASIMSDKIGEKLVVVYGYTPQNDLLIADFITGEKLGYINITERGTKYIDKDGNLTYREWFDFSTGLYNSINGDKISFFAICDKNGKVSGLNTDISIDGNNSIDIGNDKNQVEQQKEEEKEESTTKESIEETTEL